MSHLEDRGCSRNRRSDLFGDSFYFPATCDASFLGCFSSHLGPVRHSRLHRRLGDSGREQTVKKHRSVTKPAPLRRRAQQALRLPPELRACVCLTERSRMRGVQGGLVTVCALTHPPPPKRHTVGINKDIQMRLAGWQAV